MTAAPSVAVLQAALHMAANARGEAHESPALPRPARHPLRDLRRPEARRRPRCDRQDDPVRHLRQRSAHLPRPGILAGPGLLRRPRGGGRGGGGRAGRQAAEGRQNVMLSAAVGCVLCAPCLAGDINQCRNNQMQCYGLSHRLEGCQAEYIRVPAADFNAAPIPEGLSEDQALMLTDNLPTAWPGLKGADPAWRSGRGGGPWADRADGRRGGVRARLAGVRGRDLVPERRAIAESLARSRLARNRPPR